MKKILLIILITFIPLISFSQEPEKPKTCENVTGDEYCLLEPLPCIEGVGNCEEGGTIVKKIDLKNYILYIYKMFIALGVFLAIVMIIWGGFEYIGSEVPFIKSNGKGKINNAIGGLAMILVSYLVLLTIDPRLVNIDTTIPKIKYDQAELDAAKNFQAKLDGELAELKNLSKENQEKVNENNTKIQDLQRQREDVLAQYQKGEIPDEQERDFQLAGIDEEINNLQTNKKVIVANNNGVVSFTKAVGLIYNPTDTSFTDIQQYTADQIPNPRGREDRPINSPNAIQNQYNQQINALLKIGGNNFDEIQILEKQRDFFIEQAKKEDIVGKSIRVSNYSALEIIQLGEPRGYYRDQLSIDLSKDKANIVDENKITNSGISKDLYTKIIQARIDRIQVELDRIQAE